LVAGEKIRASQDIHLRAGKVGLGPRVAALQHEAIAPKRIGCATNRGLYEAFTLLRAIPVAAL
jgi:hypothetical protein